ncbi:hypothetical protein BU14_0014s0034 [Porphyra umbilicalis]|uniref:Uncharacterized protein n=1 Tax=Porphyra umbilicalis TaxID=2786 RepID=A0A1X6PKZ6_PORUM|nr:hypothetical protein BU14_0014s0034 [Porphyra umbilicalis]|eukprot:OSX81482.1 hypothetical protein BU14_0014s0034 [Porphyra umbilicalis]
MFLDAAARGGVGRAGHPRARRRAAPGWARAPRPPRRAAGRGRRACAPAAACPDLVGIAEAPRTTNLMAVRRQSVGLATAMETTTPTRPRHHLATPDDCGAPCLPLSPSPHLSPRRCGSASPRPSYPTAGNRGGMGAARMQVVPVSEEERSKENAEDEANRKAERAMQARAEKRARRSGSMASANPGQLTARSVAVLPGISSVRVGVSAAVPAAAALVTGFVRSRPPPPPSQSAPGAGGSVAVATDEISVAHSAPAVLPSTGPRTLANGGESQSVCNLPAMLRARGDQGYGTPASPGYIRPETPPPSDSAVGSCLPPTLAGVPTTGPCRPLPRRSGSSLRGLSAAAGRGYLPPIGRAPSVSFSAMEISPPPRRRHVAFASQPVDADAGSPSTAKKAKPSVATVAKAVAAKAKQTAAAAAKRVNGPASKLGGHKEAKKLKTLTLATFTKAVHDAARPAMALASRHRAGAGGASSEGSATPSPTDVDAALVQAVMDGLRPVLLEVVETAKSVEHLRGDLSRLAKKVEVQGVGHETTARAVVQLRDGPPPEVKDEMPVKPVFVADGDEEPIDVERLALADTNYRDMAGVRTEVRKTLEAQTAHTTTSLTVLHGPDRMTEVMSEVVERLHKCNAAEANTYLCHPIVFPVRNKPTKTQMVRVQKRINGHVSHMLTDFRKWALPPFWEVLQIDGDDIQLEEATTWLEKDEFILSEKGQKAVAAAAKGFFRRAGAHNRTVKGTGLGGVEHVTMTVGHFMLFGSFARHELMVAAGLRPRHRAGSADGTYKWWCEEAVLVRSVMPPDSRVFNGISIVDAKDPR